MAIPDSVSGSDRGFGNDRGRGNDRAPGDERTSGMSAVPEDWFVDPVRLGVPGVRQGIDSGSEAPGGALSWQVDSLCAQTDPEAFFPEKGGSTRDAKKICTSCEVRAQCLEYALENDERFGIWGGLSERERRKLRRRA
ncbi:transcription factor WhiB [Rathayibacter sp. PhB185]|nr:transcription factor WhiB [Rathayibacter sp. PhB186]ROS55961.1 transcription factor WhiB [Rathayibacter sp. PhB185]TCL84573.1 transcription factor WhiB [Rathayibacter sp. PhB192]TCM30291.1 transcription factor WhiB [Rathayibacter sp. PhB179]